MEFKKVGLEIDLKLGQNDYGSGDFGWKFGQFR